MSCSPFVRWPAPSAVNSPAIATGPAASNPLSRNAYCPLSSLLFTPEATTVMLRACVAVRAVGVAESVAVTEKLVVAVVVGDPVIAPVVLLSVRPAGSKPTVTAHVTGGVPPLDSRVVLYATPNVPFGSVFVVIARGAASTMMLIALLASCCGVLVSAACTVKFDVPGVVGVPEITPVPLFSVRPTGNVPRVTLHVIGAEPPLDCSCWL